MKKIDKIKEFIINNKPTHKELVTYIVVSINKLCKLDEYVHNNYRGYYSTNFTKWKRNGQVKVDSKGRYCITPIGLKSKKSLYSLPLSVKVKQLEKQLSNFKKHYGNLNYEYRISKRKINEIENVLLKRN